MKKIQTFLPILLFLSLLMFVVYRIYVHKINQLDNFNEVISQEFLENYDIAILHFRAVSTFAVEMVKKNRECLPIFKEAYHADKATRDRLRKELHEELKEEFKILREMGIKQFHFHFPDGESFLRFHRPEKFGDSLFPVRHSIYAANTEHRPVSGFEEGRIFNGYRFVFPLFWEGEHIGSVETSVGYAVIGDFLERVKPYHLYFIFDRQAVESKVFSDQLKNYEESYVSPHYLHENNTFYNPMKYFEREEGHEKDHHEMVIPKETFVALNKTLEKRFQKEPLPQKPEIIRVPYHDQIWMVFFQPVYNIKQELAGYAIFYRHDNMVENMSKRFRLNMIIIGSAFLMIMLMMVLMMRARWKIGFQRDSLEIQQKKLNELNSTLENRIHEELHKSREKDRILIQQSRMAAMGEMISNIAHQWRQPLNALGVLVQNQKRFFERGQLDQEKMERMTEKSKMLIDQMSHTIDDFRDFFKPDREKEVFLVYDIVHKSAELIQVTFEEAGIRIEISACCSSKIFGYPHELSQVLLNLLVNARDAIVENGISSGNVRITCMIDKDQVKILVCDNGGGVPEEVKEKIFDPYFSTKEEGKGTGIGLHMSRMIIEEHMEGKITVENRDGGACFTICFPAVLSGDDT